MRTMKPTGCKQTDTEDEAEAPISGDAPGWLSEDSQDEVDGEFSWLDETDEVIEEIGTAVTSELVQR